jgi:hypothetical protein
MGNGVQELRGAAGCTAKAVGKLTNVKLLLSV